MERSIMESGSVLFSSQRIKKGLSWLNPPLFFLPPNLLLNHLNIFDSITLVFIVIR